VFARQYFRIAAGGETGSVTVACGGTGAKGVAFINRYRSTVKAPIQMVGSTTGLDSNTASTAISMTGSSLTTLLGDRIAKAMTCLAPSGSYTGNATSPAMTQSTATISYTSRFAGRTGTNTMVYEQGDANVTAAGAGAPVFTATAAGASAGGVAGFVVLREEVNPEVYRQAVRRSTNW
jgi:hypothetical protein